MTSMSPKPEDGYQASANYTRADWDEVSDNPPLTDTELAQLRPASEVPEVYALLPKRPRGRPKVAAPKVNFTMRIDPVLLDAYKAMGEGWQRMMQEGLSLYLDALRMPVPPKAGRDGRGAKVGGIAKETGRRTRAIRKENG